MKRFSVSFFLFGISLITTNTNAWGVKSIAAEDSSDESNSIFRHPTGGKNDREEFINDSGDEPLSPSSFSSKENDDLEKILDSTLAYGNFLNLLKLEAGDEDHQKRLMYLIAQLMGGRTEIEDRIGILSGITELEPKKRLGFCQAMAEIPSHNTIPGWIIYQLSQCGDEQHVEFFHNLKLWVEREKQAFPFPDVTSSEEEKMFEEIFSQLYPKGSI